MTNVKVIRTNNPPATPLYSTACLETGCIYSYKYNDVGKDEVIGVVVGYEDKRFIPLDVYGSSDLAFDNVWDVNNTQSVWVSGPHEKGFKKLNATITITIND
jgi:hypothetical protein